MTTVVVVGAGIIGVAIAPDLQRRGRDAVLVDRGPVGMGASCGNMASIAATEIMPASRPAVSREVSDPRLPLVTGIATPRASSR